MIKILGFDVETAKAPRHFRWRDGFYLTCIAVSTWDNKQHIWWFEHDAVASPDYAKNFKEIQTIIDQHDIVSAHNLKFDLNIVRNNLKFPKLWCTMVGEYLLRNQNRTALKLNDTALRYGLSPKIDKVAKMWEAGFDTREIPVALIDEYCKDDAAKHQYIARKQYGLIWGRGLGKLFELQMEWLDLLSEMECNGILWDKEQAEKILYKYRKYGDALDRSVRRLIEPFIGGHTLNLNSNEDLSALIYGGVIQRKEKVPVIKTKNVKVQMPYVFTYKDGSKKIKLKWNQHPDTKILRLVFGTKQYSIPGLGIKPPSRSEAKKHTKDRPLYKVDKITLASLKPETTTQKAIIKILLKKSVIDQVIKTFCNPDNETGLMYKVAKDGRLHTNYNQCVTATGRLSSSDPNSQNFPRGNTSPIKTCIVPEFDGIMNADLSQIEWRVPAQLSQDSVMISEIVNGVDQHASACVELMGLKFIDKDDKESKRNRNHAKTFNFRMIYGGTEYGFFKDPNMPHFKLARWGDIIKAFFKKYKGLKQWQDGNIRSVASGNGTLLLPTGRKYVFKLGPTGKYNEREIKNYPVQGTAGGDILPLAACIIRKQMQKRQMKSKFILTVHDSIVFDYVESEKRTLAKLCLYVFNNLARYIKQYWGIDWVVPLTGEIETGRNYGSQKHFLG